MQLIDMVLRNPTPTPWTEGDNIPWNDPEFSRRMLREHLSQDHDAASRRFEIIDRHVDWIHHHLLLGRPGKILDLGCGPGLYTSRLARRGHSCVGIDYSPASIEYAAQCAQTESLRCTYVQQDIRLTDFGSGYDLVMCLFGEFNILRPAHVRDILRKAREALVPGGQLLLEPHTFSAIRRLGESAPTWYSSQAGLFSDQPHLCLKESRWGADDHVATIRYFVVDAASAQVTRHVQSLQAYSDEEYRLLLSECHFEDVHILASLPGSVAEVAGDFMAIMARKGAIPTTQ
jgi:SAM-dependent methyltransferase